MTEQSKRRIVGGIVVLLGGTALLPFLLRGKGNLDGFYDIPPPPQFNRFEVQRLESPLGVEEIEQKLAEVRENRVRVEERQKEETEPQASKEADSLAVEEERQPIKDGLDEIVFNEQGVPLRWVVQMISYRNRANARAFRQRLHKEGFPVVMREVTNSKQQVFYVVYVGPVLSRSKAVEYKTKLDKAYNTEGIIRTWN